MPKSGVFRDPPRSGGDGLIPVGVLIREFRARHLQAEMPHTQKCAIVEDLIKVLEITHIRDSVVGGVAKRGISGGQKKRGNIGLELVAYPRMIFLDEPTSGLDSTASLHVGKCLMRLRNSGISTVCVIHQPRFLVFNCFSDLVVLAPGGKLVYLGPPQGIHEYLFRLGFHYTMGDNVADRLIDVVSAGEKRFKNASSYTKNP